MSHVTTVLALASLAALGGCTGAPANLSPTVADGWTTYAQSRINTPIPCGATPIQLTGDRLDTHVTGACRRVRITGAHNDIVVDIVPGGMIEIVGSNNDVFWTKTGPGPRPQLIDLGVSNTFHQQEG